MSDIIFMRLFSTFSRFDAIFKLTKNYKSQVEAIKVLHKFTEDVILNRQAELVKQFKESNGVTAVVDEDDIGQTKKRLSLMDLLLQSNIDGKPLTNKEIREEVDTFM